MLCTEIDDEESRKALASPLFPQESEEEAGLRQTCHSNEERLLKRSQSISVSTGRPVCWQTQKRKSSKDCHDDRVRTVLELQKERLLSEARSEVLKYKNQTGMAEDYIRELKSQVGSQEMDFRSAMEGRAYSRRQQDLLHEELADRERALRVTQIRGIHELEALKRVQKLRVDEFSKRKMIEDHTTIQELTGKVQELQNEIHCMRVSRDFKDAESARSGQLSHVPSEPASFPLCICPGGFLGRPGHLQPDTWNTHGKSGNVFFFFFFFCEFTCVLFSTLLENTRFMG